MVLLTPTLYSLIGIAMTLSSAIMSSATPLGSFSIRSSSSISNASSSTLSNTTSVSSASATSNYNATAPGCGFDELDATDWQQDDIDTWLPSWWSGVQRNQSTQNLTAQLLSEYAPDVSNSAFTCNVFQPCSVRFGLARPEYGLLIASH